MNDSDLTNEQQLDHNRESMRRIDRIFKYSFYICAAVALVRLLMGLAMGTAILMTLDHSAANVKDAIVGTLISLLHIGIYLWSYMKDKRGTIAAMILIALSILLNITNVVSVLFSFVRLGLQIYCFRQYKEFEYLKTQPGYPDFPGFTLSTGGKRIMSDEQIKERLKTSGTAMDGLSADGNTLGSNEEKHSPNNYMDELFTDEAEQNKKF